MDRGHPFGEFAVEDQIVDVEYHRDTPPAHITDELHEARGRGRAIDDHGIGTGRVRGEARVGVEPERARHAMERQLLDRLVDSVPHRITVDAGDPEDMTQPRFAGRHGLVAPPQDALCDVIGALWRCNHSPARRPDILKLPRELPGAARGLDHKYH